MIIRKLWIDGFGVFHNYSLNDLGRGVQVLFGLNEAGKTTLLAFVRGMLFGFPSARRRASQQNLYAPVHGGRLGGRMELMLQDGRAVRLERHRQSRGESVRVTDADGSSLADQWESLLGVTTKDVFEKVYAFGLQELFNVDLFNEEQLRERLLSGTTGLGDVSLAQVMSSLQDTRDSLFKRRASKPRLNALFKQMTTNSHEIAERHRDMATYERLRRREQELKKAIERRRGEIDGLERDYRYHELLGKAYGPYIKLRDARREMEKLPPVDSFPDEGLSRFDQLLNDRKHVSEQLQSQQEKLAQRQVDLEQLMVDEGVLNAAAKIEELNQRLQNYRDDCDALPRRESQLESAERELQNLLEEMGPGWDEDRVARFVVSVATEQEVRQWDEQLKGAEAAKGAAKSRIESAQEALADAQKAEQRARAALEKTPPIEPDNERTWEQRNEAVERLCGLFPEHESVRQRIDSVRQRIQQLQFELQKSETPPFVMPKYPCWLCWGVAAIFAVEAIISFAFERLMFTLALGGLGVLLWRIARQSEQRLTQWRKHREAESERAEGEIAERQGEISQLQEREAGVQKRIQSAARIAGIEDIEQLSLETVEEHRFKVVRGLQRARERNRLRADVSAAEEGRQDAEQRLQQRQQALTEAHEHFHRLHSQWKQWLQEKGLPAELMPQTAQRFFERARRARDQHNTLEQQRNELTGIRKRIRQFEQDTKSLLAALGEAKNAPAEQVVVSLGQRLTEAREVKAKREAILEAIRELEEEAEELNRRYNQINNELRKLLKEADVETEQDFRHRAKVFEQRQELKEQISQHEIAIKLLVGEQRLEQTLQRLAEFDPAENQRKLAHINEQLESLQHTQEQENRELGEVRNEIKSLATSDQLAQLLMKREALAAEIETAAQEWAVKVLALELLERTRSIYEREKQPAIIQNAQRWFERITQGRYKRIIAPLGGGEISVELADGARLELAHLSRGTREQLYLSVRFGLIEQFDRNAEPLPVLMDDVLVNFDDVRAGEATRSIVEFAHKRQVLLFTCHKQTVDLLCQADPAVRVIKVEP